HRSLPLSPLPLFVLTPPPPPDLSLLSLHDALPIWIEVQADLVAELGDPPQGIPCPRQVVDRLVHGMTMHGHEQAVNEAIYDLPRSEEHTSELQSLTNLVCRLLLEKKQQYHHRLSPS